MAGNTAERLSQGSTRVLSSAIAAEPGSGCLARTGVLQNLADRGVGSWASRAKVRPCGTLWPNGEFTLGFAKRETPEPSTRLKSMSVRPLQVGDLRDAVRNYEARFKARTIALAWVLQNLPGSLGLSLVRNSNKRRGKYGSKGITSYGQRMVRSAASMLQRRWSRHRLSFLTLTVPELSEKGLHRVAAEWGGLMSQLIQFLRRYLSRRGLPEDIVAVTELQPKRLQCGSLGCLHVHALFVGRRTTGEDWALKPRIIREWWNKALSRVSGENCDSDAVENLKRVRKSAEGYLGKYMTKGSDGADKLKEWFGEDVIPGQWWAMSASLRVTVKRACIKGDKASEFLESVVNAHFEGNWLACKAWIKALYIAHNGGVILVGYTGRLSREQYIDIREVMEELRPISVC